MRIAVLGASGLIGEAVTRDLVADGFDVVAMARRFTPRQMAAFGARAVEAPFVAKTAQTLAATLEAHGVGVVVNCVGALQASGKSDPREVHAPFVARLLDALGGRALIHLSMPGEGDDDPTPFSRSKRAADADIAARAGCYAILRPGFVIAPTPYGASALLRALATTAFDLPGAMRSRPFAPVAVADISETIAALARRALAGERFSVTWDLCAAQPRTLGEVADAFRRRFGAPAPRFAAPMALATLTGVASDVVARLGWLAPTRSTALREIARGVVADPSGWMAATGARPRSLDAAMLAVPADAARFWFARLYWLKPLIVATLALFWIVSGVVALSVGYAAAARALRALGWSEGAASAFTMATALADIGVGALISVRRTHGVGLAAGAALALAYVVGATAIAPGLWSDPLGPLVKVFPTLALSAAAWAIAPDR
ncbi:MAG: SDR family oxidoreductase [Rhodoblastus sp.]|nr:MAG: SDR family oxidoreductase [Rhodoblastus sp.]